MAPSTITQLVIIALFVLPGSAYQIVRARLAGEVPQNKDTANKLLRALAASVVLGSLYLIVLGPTLVRALGSDGPGMREWIATHARLAGLLALLLLFLTPAGAAVIAARRWLLGERLAERRGQGILAGTHRFGGSVVGRFIDRLLTWVADRTAGRGGLQYDATPTAWDWAVDHAADGVGFVRVLGPDSAWKGGAFSGRSYFTAFPEPPAVFVEQAWQLDERGTFVAEQDGTRGAWIPCDGALTVEFLSRSNGGTDDSDG